MSILAILQQQNGAWHRMCWETLAAAQELSKALNVDLQVAAAGKSLGALIQQAQDKQSARFWSVEHDLLEQYTADGFTTAFEQLIRQLKLTVVLFPHTYQVRDFAPKLAARFGQALLSDVIHLKTAGDQVVCTRQFFQGKLSGDVKLSGAGPHFISLQAGAWRGDQVAASADNVAVQTFSPTLDAADIRQKPDAPFREAARAVDLTAADIIVAVGRGIKEQSNIALVEPLARALGAEMAASRPICDAGWMPMERQVGSSGQTVAPKMYLAVGISGAIQHLVGMKGAKTIVAINKDANAPIFEVADYGVVGDLFEVIPALTAEIEKLKG